MRAITGSSVSLLVGSRTAHGGCGESIVLMVLLLLHAHFLKSSHGSFIFTCSFSQTDQSSLA